MKISLKVSADFEINETGPVFHVDVNAEIDGDGPDVIELERMSNEHQRAMVRDAHEFMQAAAPVLFELLASLRETGPDRPAGDVNQFEQSALLAAILTKMENRLEWLGDEQRAMVNRIAAIEAGGRPVHGDVNLSEQIVLQVSGLTGLVKRIQQLEETSIPAGWCPSNLTHERTGATAFRAGQTWVIYGPGQVNPSATGATLNEAIRNAGDRFSPDFEEG